MLDLDKRLTKQLNNFANHLENNKIQKLEKIITKQQKTIRRGSEVCGLLQIEFSKIKNENNDLKDRIASLEMDKLILEHRLEKHEEK